MIRYGTYPIRSWAAPVSSDKGVSAASRRSLGRVSVPVWLIVLSDQLWIVALVGHYPANKLIHRGLILDRRPKLPFLSRPKARKAIRY